MTRLRKLSTKFCNALLDLVRLTWRRQNIMTGLAIPAGRLPKQPRRFPQKVMTSTANARPTAFWRAAISHSEKPSKPNRNNSGSKLIQIRRRLENLSVEVQQ